MRFLPATKAIPKEMLPIVDKPTIQYVVEEAVQSGLKDVTFVTSSSKTEIENHFDYDYRLEHRLREQGKLDLLDHLQQLKLTLFLELVLQPGVVIKVVLNRIFSAAGDEGNIF